MPRATTIPRFGRPTLGLALALLAGIAALLGSPRATLAQDAPDSPDAPEAMRVERVAVLPVQILTPTNRGSAQLAATIEALLHHRLRAYAGCDAVSPAELRGALRPLDLTGGVTDGRTLNPLLDRLDATYAAGASIIADEDGQLVVRGFWWNRSAGTRIAARTAILDLGDPLPGLNAFASELIYALPMVGDDLRVARDDAEATRAGAATGPMNWNSMAQTADALLHAWRGNSVPAWDAFAAALEADPANPIALIERARWVAESDADAQWRETASADLASWLGAMGSTPAEQAAAAPHAALLVSQLASDSAAADTWAGHVRDAEPRVIDAWRSALGTDGLLDRFPTVVRLRLWVAAMQREAGELDAALATAQGHTSPSGRLRADAVRTLIAAGSFGSARSHARYLVHRDPLHAGFAALLFDATLADLTSHLDTDGSGGLDGAELNAVDGLDGSMVTLHDRSEPEGLQPTEFAAAVGALQVGPFSLVGRDTAPSDQDQMVLEIWHAAMLARAATPDEQALPAAISAFARSAAVRQNVGDFAASVQRYLEVRLADEGVDSIDPTVLLVAWQALRQTAPSDPAVAELARTLVQHNLASLPVLRSLRPATPTGANRLTPDPTRLPA